MATTRKATRNAAGGELTAEQVPLKYDEIRGSSRRIPRQQTMKLVRKHYSQGEVQVESTKQVSLVCPFSKRRIVDACRGERCLHLECFDLRSYLQYHTQLTYWECPVLGCRENVSLERLTKGEPKPVKEEPVDITVQPAKELSEHAKETILYLAIRANFEAASVSEFDQRVQAVAKDKRRRFNTILRTFLLLQRLPKKENELPEKLESVKYVGSSGLSSATIHNYKKRIDELNKFMLEKARTVLNADTGPGNICIVGCPRRGPDGDSDDRIACAGCSVSYHTKCLAIDGLVEGLFNRYFCPKCEDDTQTTEFVRNKRGPRRGNAALSRLSQTSPGTSARASEPPSSVHTAHCSTSKRASEAGESEDEDNIAARLAKRRRLAH